MDIREKEKIKKKTKTKTKKNKRAINIQFTKNRPIVILGHGTDVCKSDGNLDVLPVPKGCVYVTFTLCGLMNLMSDKELMQFFEYKNQEYLKDPVKYEKELNAIFKNEIHIHHPDAKDEHSRTYVNSEYSPHLIVTNSIHGFAIHMSGIVELSDSMNYKAAKYYTNPDEDILDYYTYSVFPNKENMKRIFDSKTEVSDYTRATGKITQAELFELNPGVYFNPLCRVVHKRCDGAIAHRRQESLRAMDVQLDESHMDVYLKNFAISVRQCMAKATKCGELEFWNKEIPNMAETTLRLLLKTLRNRTIFPKSFDVEPNYVLIKNRIDDALKNPLFQTIRKIIKVGEGIGEEEEGIKKLVNAELHAQIYTIEQKMKQIHTLLKEEDKLQYGEHLKQLRELQKAFRKN